MAYWCLYYAAQVGLDLKTHEPGARDYLLALITLLEKMKKDIGVNDAVDHESAGAAYVENFALRLFKLADEEDRRGEATRSTAKKFLAAANFLELLKVFEKSNNAVVNEEKVRYAKWKASDLAKAFREGRKPTPGSPHADAEEEYETAQEPPAEPSSSNSVPPDIIVNGDSAAGQRTPPKKIKFPPSSLSVPPPEMSSPGSWSTVATPGSVDGSGSSPARNILFASAVNRMTSGGDPEDSPLRSKGQNAGTSDTASASTLINSNFTNDFLPFKKVHFSPSVVGGLSSTDGSPPTSPEFTGKMFTSVSSLQKSQPQQIPFQPARSADPTSIHLPDSSPSESSRASLEGSSPPGSSMRRGVSPPSARQSGSPPTSGVSDRMRPGSSPPRAGGAKPDGSPPGDGGAKLSSSPPSSSRSSGQPSAPHLPPSHSAERRERRASNASRHSPPQVNAPRLPQPPLPPVNASSYSSTSSTVVSSSPPFPTSGKLSDKLPVPGPPPVHPVYVHQHYTPPSGAPVPAPPPPRVVPVELTSSVIAKAQKHARFAISALEYEDAVTARKQLRDALAVLGES